MKIMFYISTALLAAALLAAPAVAQKEGKYELEREKIDPERVQRSEDRFIENLSAAMAYLRTHPEQARELAGDRDLKEIYYALEKGSIDEYVEKQSVRFAKINAESKRSLQPVVFTLADFGNTLRTGRDYELVKANYVQLAAQLGKKKKFRMVKLFSGKPILSAELFGDIWRIIFGDDPEPEPVPGPVNDTSQMSCAGEVGYSATRGDSATACLPPGAAAGTNAQNLSSSGLLGNRVIPLEPHLTCTKDQRRRGTCVGFAITANLETRASVGRGTKYNFSEQYNYFKSEIYTGNSRYKYGLSTQSTTEDWADDNWATGRETSWDYNPSTSIKDLDTGSIWTYHDNVYPDSCDGYSGFCTDYAFQGEPNSNHTTFTRPSPQSSQDNLEARTASKITWGWFKSAESALMNEVVPLLAARVPVIVSFSVTEDYMDGNDGPGYIKWSSSDKNRSGGHANLLVGYVDKNNLPAGAPTPEGNGYFISKNSWGAGRGDCGYDYLDEKWLRKKMTSLTTLTVN